MDDATSDLFRFATPADVHLCTCSRVTWYRWRTGRARPPAAVIALLRILVAGELPQGGGAWYGWRFLRGELVDPSGIAHTPATILAWHWLADQLQEARRAENLRDRDLPANVHPLPSARPAHALTRALSRRIEGES